ncbi:MAG TPA: CoA transferase, partial [Allosphingosinicella sp.]
MAGVLSGIRIVELAGIGPAPFAGMMLADHGATVFRVEREDRPPVIPPEFDILGRSRASTVRVDLKSEEGVARVRELARDSDGLIEGFRPGVMERLGLGPDLLLEDNPRLVYGRMTGWGQEGPLAGTAGHDINYIALAGALHTYGREGGAPVPPVNAV